MKIKGRFPYETTVVVESEEDEKKLQEFVASRPAVRLDQREPAPETIQDLIFHVGKKEKIFDARQVIAEFDALGLVSEEGPFRGDGIKERVSATISYLMKTEKLTRVARGQYAIVSLPDRFSGARTVALEGQEEELSAERCR
jgi:hypothetical protein